MFEYTLAPAVRQNPLPALVIPLIMLGTALVGAAGGIAAAVINKRSTEEAGRQAAQITQLQVAAQQAGITATQAENRQQSQEAMQKLFVLAGTAIAGLLILK